ncbi:MAG: hypothetical protein M0R66_08350, partial [Candidatus Omnitrophica bacterium]|nr:hypothetical protein [Candidatus Omnitrophota bacterium]
GLVIGFILFKLTRLKLSFRQDSLFCGAELTEQKEDTMVTGTEFYNTVRDIGWIGYLYKKAEQGVFDIYEQGKRIFCVSRFLQFLHNGVLPTYLVWILLGMAGLFLILAR